MAKEPGKEPAIPKPPLRERLRPYMPSWPVALSALALILAFVAFVRSFQSHAPMSLVEEYAITKHLLDAEFRELQDAQRNGDPKWKASQMERFNLVKEMSREAFAKLKASREKK